MNSQLNIRIDKNIIEKTRQISNNEKRSINKQVELILENYIKTYETEHGPIQIDE